MGHKAKSAAVVGLVLLTAFGWSPAAHGASIVGTTNSDVLFGTNENDAIDSLGAPEGETELIFGKKGKDKISTGDGGAIIMPGAHRDNVDAGVKTDIIFDDDGKNKGQKKGDVLNAGAENFQDLIISADGQADTLDCGPDDGTLTDLAVVDPNDVVTNCEQIAVGTGQPVSTNGVLVAGGKEDDVLVATNAGKIDILVGKNGNDSLNGDADQDYLLGGKGADTLNGNAEADLLVDDDGTPGDTLNGGSEDDFIFAADGAATTIDCGAGAGDVAFVDANDTQVNCENINTLP